MMVKFRPTDGGAPEPQAHELPQTVEEFLYQLAEVGPLDDLQRQVGRHAAEVMRAFRAELRAWGARVLNAKPIPHDLYIPRGWIRRELLALVKRVEDDGRV